MLLRLEKFEKIWYNIIVKNKGDRGKLNKVKLQAIAKSIKDLEIKCQKGVDIDENEKKMAELMSALSLDELLTLAVYLEDIDLQS